MDLRFRAEALDVDQLAAEYDVVLAADGANSAIRMQHAEVFGPSLERRHAKYMWLGTDKVFEAFEFHIRETRHGVVQVHGYPFDDKGSTFILEMHEDVWRAAGFDAFADREWRPGDSDEKSIERVEEICADILDGHEARFAAMIAERLRAYRGYQAIQQVPGIGPVLAAVFVAEIGDAHRFPGPAQLTCWAGLTPSHHESDTTVHRGRITKQGSRLVRWAAIESVKVLPDTSRIGAIREQVAHRRAAPPKVLKIRKRAR